jgi:hypothetical protein
LDAVVFGSVVGGVLVVVVGSIVVVVVAVVDAAVVVCDLEISGRNVSNCVNKKKVKIDIILYLLLVGGTHSECPRAHAIGRRNSVAEVFCADAVDVFCFGGAF